MNNTSLISIGIPCYNRFDGLMRTLECVTHQTYKNIEIIISDNCSPDQRIETLVNAYIEKDNRIKYIRQPENIGAINNFLFVLSQATGDQFLWAADDDIMEAEYITSIQNISHHHSDCAIAFCDFDWVKEDLELIANYLKVRDLSVVDKFQRLKTYILQEENLGKANPIYGLFNRLALIEAVRKLGNNFNIMGGDMLLVFELLQEGNIYIQKEKLFHKLGSYPSTEPRETPTKIEMYKTFRKNWNDWNAYLSGYIHSINRTSLNSEEKIKLRFLVEGRWKNKMAELYQSEGGRILPSIITKLVHRQNLK